ncbi:MULTISPECIES: hypothetical protein [Pseudomonas]|uniref:hypothetical protein n=1 Tax=Pseudomonas TaxID=286 RepID=UPI0015ACCDDA|nr:MULTISPECIES: hypothetical protein [Pseudomonas]MDU9415755.1 hypothetical protein [Pseudomonas sp. zfem005]MDW3711858.1 hypothetical protein [Pseudomonas sp. 2023EL-01195]
MARNPEHALADLGQLLAAIRNWPCISEPRPGSFYLGHRPFCHIRVRGARRWVDIRMRRAWLPRFDLPPNDAQSRLALRILLHQAYRMDRQPLHSRREG